jgi:signal transduction histidine kinase
MAHLGRLAPGWRPDARSLASTGAEWLARLGAATERLAAALTPAEVSQAIATARLPGGPGRLVALLADDGAELVVVAASGIPPELVGRLARVPLSSDHLFAAVVRTRRARFAPDLAALPLVAGERDLGVLALSTEAARAPGREERAFLLAFAAQAAQALLRARLLEAERAARLEAQRAAEAARHAVELQERLVGVVGHDLRTPLAAVHIATTLLARRGTLSHDEARTVGRIGASVARMTAIVRDLLDFGRIRREGRIPVARRDVDLAEVAARSVAELRAVHSSREIALDARGPVPVVGDPERLAQVVSNLVGNALQHGPPDVAVRVVAAATGGEALLEVHNAGAPIPPALLADMFEPFRRGPSGPDPSGSVGLGLFIVRELARAHGGEVAVRSAQGEGTTFTVRLPAAAGASTGRPSAND